MLNLKNIHQYLAGSLNAESIVHSMHDSTGFKLGGSKPIYLIEDCDIIITAIYICRILKDFINDKISKGEMSYLCDGLLLSEKVHILDENLKDIMDEMTDFEINGDFTKDEARNLIKRLNML